jgi:guanylate kinase
MKIGTGNAENYRLTSPGDLASLRASADVLYQNERYGNTYIVDRPHLAAMLGAGQTPVLHLGQIEGIHAVTAYPAHWITVLLWCSRETTAQRVHARGSDDVEARLTVWDETADDLKNACEADFDALLGTETMTPQHAARIIAALVIAQGAPTP